MGTILIWLVFALVILFTGELSDQATEADSDPAPDSDSVSASGWQWWLARTPGHVWMGLGAMLLGLLWGEAGRVPDVEPIASPFAATAVAYALIIAVSRDRTRPGSARLSTTLGSLLIWLALGIFFTGFLNYPYALLGLVGRRVALVVALFFIVIGGVRWRDER